MFLFQDHTTGRESTLHLEDECTWRRRIPDMIKGMDHFLGYPNYARTPANLCLGVVSTHGWVLEMIALVSESRTSFNLLLVFHSDVFTTFKTQYLYVFMYFLHIFLQVKVISLLSFLSKSGIWLYLKMTFCTHKVFRKMHLFLPNNLSFVTTSM